MNRRSFLKLSAAGAVVGGSLSSAEVLATPRRVAPSDRIAVGVIGPGSRGQEVMRSMSRVPGVTFRALCDVYDARFAQARAITNEDVPTFSDYRRMLEAKDLDVILVATPLSFHRDHVVAALDSGRHVYGEKSLGFNVKHCDDILAAASRSSKLFQVGHQYRYAPWIKEAVRRIHAGEIGTVTHVYAYWHRNANWRRPVPDPKLERLINWRMYREFSGGLMAELGSHHIDITNWIYGSRPASVVASGGIDYYKDGRETNDNVQSIFRYPNGGVLEFGSVTTNAKLGNQVDVFGTQGSVEITPEDARFFYEASHPKGPTDGEIVERGVKTGATFSTKGEMPYRGPGDAVQIPDGAEGNPNFVAVQSFFESLRANQRPFADVLVGYNSATSVALANRSMDEGRRMIFADLVKGHA